MRGNTAHGRNHNLKAIALRFVGGGANARHTIGSTDDRGIQDVEAVHHFRDVHVPLLRLLGLDNNQRAFCHAGRLKQLSQFGGQLIEQLMA